MKAGTTSQEKTHRQSVNGQAQTAMQGHGARHVQTSVQGPTKGQEDRRAPGSLQSGRKAVGDRMGKGGPAP